MDDPADHAPELFRGTGGRSVLQRIVRAHLPEFNRAFEDEHGGRSLPGYVQAEFQSLLECGDPDFGFTRLRCPSCAADTVVPFSCKGRTFCPSCGGRQMAQSAAHLESCVFPGVPVRQWVLSVPKPLRLALAMDAGLCRDVTRAHLRAVSASYVRRAKAAQRVEGEGDAGDSAPEGTSLDVSPTSSVRFHPGAVNATQRFGSSLELNVHQHSLFLDGVYTTHGPFDPPVFHPAGRLKPADVERVHGDIIARIRRVLERYGLSPVALGLPPRPRDASTSDLYSDSSGSQGPEFEQPLLDFGDAAVDSFFPGLKAASVNSQVPFGPRAGRPLQRLRDPDMAAAFEAAGWPRQNVPPPLVVNAHGFSLHAATRVRSHERDRLEKLCRYVTRPALCLKRLAVRADGQISWVLRKPWRDGTKAFVMTPYEFIARLAALVPHPREHQLSYHGVLAPAASLRDLVVPRRAEKRGPNPTDGDAPKHSGCLVEGQKAKSYVPWAELLKRVFGEDVLRCPRCGGRRHRISVITDPKTVRRFLESVRAGAGSERSPPNGGDGSIAEERLPMPPHQGRLDFGS